MTAQGAAPRRRCAAVRSGPARRRRRFPPGWSGLFAGRTRRYPPGPRYAASRSAGEPSSRPTARTCPADRPPAREPLDRDHREGGEGLPPPCLPSPPTRRRLHRRRRHGRRSRVRRSPPAPRQVPSSPGRVRRTWNPCTRTHPRAPAPHPGRWRPGHRRPAFVPPAARSAAGRASSPSAGRRESARREASPRPSGGTRESASGRPPRPP